jgi:hypothetical protein
MMYSGIDNHGDHVTAALPADRIMIVFIEVPDAEDAGRVRIHDASELAVSNKFMYERLFEWEIPERYVLHRVSLRTLLDRGIGGFILQSPERLQVLMERDLRDYDSQGDHPPPPLSTKALRYCISEDLKSEFEPGYYLGFFAKTFGARAPVYWIAYQLLDDCGLHGVSTSAFASYWAGAIDQVLIDWWLTEEDFIASVNEWQTEADEGQERMCWDLIDFGRNGMGRIVLEIAGTSVSPTRKWTSTEKRERSWRTWRRNAGPKLRNRLLLWACNLLVWRLGLLQWDLCRFSNAITLKGHDTLPSRPAYIPDRMLSL